MQGTSAWHPRPLCPPPWAEVQAVLAPGQHAHCLRHQCEMPEPQPCPCHCRWSRSSDPARRRAGTSRTGWCSSRMQVRVQGRAAPGWAHMDPGMGTLQPAEAPGPHTWDHSAHRIPSTDPGWEGLSWHGPSVSLSNRGQSWASTCPASSGAPLPGHPVSPPQASDQALLS